MRLSMQSTHNFQQQRLTIQTYQKEFTTQASDRQLFNALVQATQRAGATVFASGQHAFYPCGLTAFVILGESHAALHSFPEQALVWVELASCSDKINPDVFFREFQAFIKE